MVLLSHIRRGRYHYHSLYAPLSHHTAVKGGGGGKKNVKTPFASPLRRTVRIIYRTNLRLRHSTLFPAGRIAIVSRHEKHIFFRVDTISIHTILSMI